jgi:hypothetical protein
MEGTMEGTMGDRREATTIEGYGVGPWFVHGM